MIVSLATGNGQFASPVVGTQSYTSINGGWTSQNLTPRLLADVNGDGMADIIGFGSDIVTVALATGNGHFASSLIAIQNFSPYEGWVSQNLYPRGLADVNGDGMADLIGFRPWRDLGNALQRLRADRLTLSGGSAPENSPGGTIIATAHGVDPFPARC